MDDGLPWLSIIVLIILIAISALFSATETAFSSLNIIRIKQLARKSGPKGKKAKEVYHIANNFAETISAILVGNNIVNIAASTITASLMIQLFGPSGVLYATIVITILILVFGEITPKALAKQHSETFALFIVQPLKIYIIVSKPITIWFRMLQNLMNKWFGGDDQVSVTKDELLEIVQTIEHEEVLDQTEREIIQSAIDFDENKVKDVMKNVEEVIYLYETSRIEVAKNTFLDYKYSRIPILERKTGQVTGILHERDFFGAIVSGKKPSIKKLMKPVTFIPQRQSLADALEKIQKSKSHMAIVIDTLRAKNFIGIVTLEDIIEELVGEIYDEYDNLPGHVVEIGHHMYEVDANISLRDFIEEYLDDTRRPRTKMRTFSGWIKEMKKGKVKVNEKFTFDNIEMRVISMDGDNIDKIEITAFTKEDKI